MEKAELPAKNEDDSKRQANVYDAVAGRLYQRGFLPPRPAPHSTRDTASATSIPLGPKSFLATKRRSAAESLHDRSQSSHHKPPIGWTDQSSYWADRHLRPDQRLPDSDLLKALHVYASDFYARASQVQGEGDFLSMDGSALLALGVLVEEAVREELGKDGDLVFVEGEYGDGLGESTVKAEKRRDSSRNRPSNTVFRDRSARRDRKRRKVGETELGE